MVGPAARAVEAAKNGKRFELKKEDVIPGRIVWMPWAGVIKVTYNSRHRGKGDGVKVIGEDSSTRPRRRAWNHPAVIIKTSGEEVTILPITSLRTTNLQDKYDSKTKHGRYLQQGMVPILPAKDHPFFAKGDTRYRTLTTIDMIEMRLPGYVNLRTMYKMEWKDLERFPRSNASTLQLDDDSVQSLINILEDVNPLANR